ncbi:hypothetical protein JIG36_38860 [Actinoplanes sp. LDG1-06]|uniref:Uncharacterized protein n=1 Tax=Paractinoplanes ovalisporus TaxID=2810368 RepID=A0ABS2ANQ4_9ACTN|nr:hypothetical protein [Actinoplanes ovalisporus]MBM2621482.1 hypothetical protein [Actinoplanes ovalisporus]
MVERLARFAVRMAARRWPAELAGTMREEWLAELAYVRGARAKLAFAGSLLVSPALDGPSWADRFAGLGRAAGVTLAAAVVANLARGSGVFAPLLLVLAAIVLAAIGRRVRVSVPLVGAAMFVFLFAGNPVPVMPFMGAADIAPAIVTWVLVMTLLQRSLRRNQNRDEDHGRIRGRGAEPGGARGRVADRERNRGYVRTAILGGSAAVMLATIAGSARAAAALGIPAWTAPAWFPLALLPGGTVTFGPYFADGSAAFGSLQAVGPAFHASDILLANAAVMAGPLLLCTAFLLHRGGRPGQPAAIEHGVHRHQPGTDASARKSRPGSAAVPALSLRPLPRLATDALARRASRLSPRLTGLARHAANTVALAGRDLRLPAGLAAALVALAAGPKLPASFDSGDAALRAMVDNSAAFGFGFVEHPVGLGAVALLAAVLVMRAVGARAASR